MGWRATGLALIVVCALRPAAADEVFDHPLPAAELLRTTLAQPAQVLAQSKVLAGQFVQRRALAEIPKPLTSNGEFMLARDWGVYWHTLEPFVSEMALTRKEMVLRDEEVGVKRVTLRQQPALRMAMEVFSAMFALDVALLERHFVLFGREQDGRWQLGLRPREAARNSANSSSNSPSKPSSKPSRMAAVFTEAVISGSRYVERIELRAGEGDRTEIELSEVIARPTGPTAEEQRRFE